MGYGTDIQAKLGVDTSSVGTDLQGATNIFNKWGNDLANKGAEHGGGFGEKFSGALEHRLVGSRHLAGALATALGLNLEKIADSIAAAIVGGTKEGWKEAGDLAEQNAKLIEKRMLDSMNPAQLIAHFEKTSQEATRRLNAVQGDAIYAGNARYGTRRVVGHESLNAEQLKAQQQANHDILEAENQLRELRKKSAEELKKDDKGNSDYEKEWWGDAEEAQQKRLDALKKEQEQKEKLAHLDIERLELQKKLSEETSKTGDRSKLTLGELANLSGKKAKSSLDQAAEDTQNDLQSTFGENDGLTQAQIDAKQKARDIEKLEKKAEEARKSGDQAGAEDLFSKVGTMRDDLVKSGFTKSSEGDQLGELRKQIAIDNEKLQKLVGDIVQVAKGKFVNE